MQKQIKCLVAILFAITVILAMVGCVQEDNTPKHDYTFEVTREATCTEEGEIVYTCKDCDASFTESIAKLAHTPVVDEAVAPTCTTAGKTEGKHCSGCGEVFVAQKEIAALGHDYEAVVTNPTCTAGGYTTYTCSVCDDSYVADKVDALGHTEETIKGKAATCTEKGITDGKKCSVCDVTLVEQTEIAAKGHTEDVIPAKAATCTATGLTEGKICLVCGETTLAQNTVDALNHDMSAATCTKASECQRENCSYVEEGSALGHSYNEGVITTAPGCETKGIKTFTCTRTDCGDSYTVEVAATGHDYSETVVPATCISKGYTSHVCGNCGDNYTDNETALAEHSYVGVVTTEPGCETTGVKTYTCSVVGCGDSYTEVIEANGHKEVQHEGKAATCTEDGWKAYVTCENCDYTTYETVTAAGHKGGTATCVALAVCSTCGKEYGNFDLTEQGHDYGEASCDSPATCSLCGSTSGNAIGHLDANKDHVCDRTGCTEEMGVCEDTNKDHACDYGCEKVHGVCEDTDFDHKCDYGCKQTYGTCEDANKDHACDYGCSKVYGSHADGDDKNHTCDYGCNKPVDGEVCVDESPRNHICDECGANVGGECADSDDNDHLCDHCGAKVEGEVCYGGEATCTDKAVCEECGNEYGETLPHTYDQSKAVEGALKTPATCFASAVYYYSCECGDVDKTEDAKTFESGDPLTHKDENKDHKCDNGCDVAQGTCSDVTTDSDHLCDYGCGKTVTEHDYATQVTAPTCTEDGYTTYTCNCGYSYTGSATTALGHDDSTKDFLCDRNCGTVVEPAKDSTLTLLEANTLGKLTTTTNKYYVVGTITELVNTKYGNVYIKDENGNTFYIYGLYSADGETRYDSLEVKPGVGDTIKVYGVITSYSGAAQMQSGWIAEYTIHEHNYENGKCTICSGADPDYYFSVTIPEALATEDGVQVEVSGTVCEFYEAWSSYNNCSVYIKDDDGNKILVFRTTTQVSLGDKITVKGVITKYNEVNQIAQGSTVTIDVAHGDNHTYEDGVCTGCGVAETIITTIPDALAGTVGSKVELTGTVCGFYEEWSSYGNCSPYIKDENGNKILVFRTTVEVTLGDVVTVTGVIGQYNSENQVAKGNELTIVSEHVCFEYTEATCQALAACVICGATTGEKAECADNDGDEKCDVCETPIGVETKEVWILVTDISQIKVGSYIIITAKDSNVALGQIQKTNNRPQATITKSDDGNELKEYSAAEIILVESGTISDTYAFSTSAGYLYAASSSSNHLKSQATNNDNGSWLITVDTNGTATITAQGTNTRNMLRYNSGNQIFSCYSSGQYDIAIYVKTIVADDGTEVAKYTVDFNSDGGSDVSSQTIEEYGKVTEPDAPTKDGYTFAGWFNGDAQWNFDTDIVTDNITLTAKWTDNSAVESNPTKATSIAIGDTIYFVCESKAYEMSSFNGTSYAYGETYSSAITGKYAWTVVAGYSDGTFAFVNETGEYMCWSSGNSLKTSTALDANSSWNVSFDTDGNAIVLNANDNTRKLQWNASSPRFACYTSTQTEIQIYK